MVAVYLDNNSVEKLSKEFPGITRGRLRKVVVQYNPSDEERRVYEPYFGGLATVKVSGSKETSAEIVHMGTQGGLNSSEHRCAADWS